MPAFGNKLVMEPSDAVAPIHPQLKGCLAWVYPGQSRSTDLIAGYPITEHNGVVYNTNYSGRVAWECTVADGAQHVQINTRSLDGLYDYLLTAWVNIDPSSVNRTSERVFSKMADNMELHVNPSARSITSGVKTAGGEFQTTRTPTSTLTHGAGVWEFIGAHVVVGETGKIWLNAGFAGLSLETEIAARLDTGTTNVHLLSRADDKRSLNGAVSEFRLYNYNQIDRVTYPVIDSLYADIRDNPDIGLP